MQLGIKTIRKPQEFHHTGTLTPTPPPPLPGLKFLDPLTRKVLAMDQGENTKKHRGF